MTAIIQKGMPLAPRRAAQAARILLANSVLMILGWFTLITVFALHFTNDLRFTVAIVGLALALRQLMQQGLDIVGGAFADRFGYRFAITLGCMVRVLGFIGMGFTRTIPQLLFACAIAGFGGMFFDAASTASLAAVTAPARRARTFALQATLNNIAAAVGPVIGITIYSHFGFLPVALFSAVVFLWIGLQTALFLPPGVGRDAAVSTERALTPGQLARAILSRRAYVRVILLLIGYWVIVGQITLTVPLRVAAVGGKGGVALILGLNAFLAIPLQYPFVRYAERWFTQVQILAGSVLLSGLGLVMIFLAPTFGWQVIGIGITTVGSLAVGPITNSVTAQVAPPRAIGAFFGFSAISIGLGGLGQLLGGSIYDAQRTLHLPWLMGAFLVAVTASITYLLWQSPAPPATPVYTPEPLTDIASESGIMPSPAR